MLKKIFETAFDNKYISSSLFQSINTIEKLRSIKEDKDVKALSYTEQNKLVEYLESNNGKRILQINELTEKVLRNSLDNVIKNKSNILFCHPDGKFIETNTINSHFKKIYKNAVATY